MPPPSLTSHLLALLESGAHSDLALEVKYQAEAPVTFAVHAAIVCQWSDVLRAALSHGLSESTTRTIVVTDVHPLAMKALLHFMYSDDFEKVSAVLREGVASNAANGEGGEGGEGGSSSSAPVAAAAHGAAAERMALLHAVLTAAHKYNVLRLLRWAEGQCCELLTCESVCSMLGMAQLYDASELEKNCLEYMGSHMKEVVARPEFAALDQSTLVKFQRYQAGVLDASTKRKRDE